MNDQLGPVSVQLMSGGHMLVSSHNLELTDCYGSAGSRRKKLRHTLVEKAIRRAGKLAVMAVVAAGIAVLPQGAKADDIIVNGSFETGDFTGWDTVDLATPYSPLVVRGAGPASFGFETTPTDGSRVADHGFDGGGPGIIEISQVVAIPDGVEAILTFDWRAGWGMFVGAASRSFDVIVEPATGGAALLTSNLITAQESTNTPDTGPQTAAIDLSGFAGQSVRIRLSSNIPQNFTGPAHLQIDNVALNTTVIPDDDDPPVVAGPSDAEIAERTRRAIGNFMSRRADHITANENSMAYRLMRRGGQTRGPVTITGDGGSGSGFTDEVAFSTSLQQMQSARQASEDQTRNQLGRMMGLGMDDAGPSGAAPHSRFDIWARGTWAEGESFAADNSIGLFYLGADYRISENLLLGVMSQFDWTDEHDATEGVDGEGQGWLVGPYVVLRLRDNLIFDGSARWGQADNSVTLHNAFASSGSYDSDRWLITGTLTGDFAVGRLEIAPSASLLYFEESQDDFTNNLGIHIPGQTISLGRLTFGPKISTSMTASDGTVVSPFVSLKGLWDFERSHIVDLTTGLAAGTDELRARIESGATFELPSGLLLSGEGFYDGIGASDFEAYGGSAKLVMPLN